MESETGGERPLDGPSPGVTPAHSEDDSSNTGVSTGSSESDIFNGALEGDAAPQTDAPKDAHAKIRAGDRKKRTKEHKKCKRKSTRIKIKLHRPVDHAANNASNTSTNNNNGPAALCCEEKASTDSLDCLTHRVYVTSTHVGAQVNAEHFFEKFRATVSDIIGSSRFKLYQTASGLIATFYNEEDLNQVLATDLAKRQGVPVQVCKFTRTGPCYRRYVMIGRVPWCVPVTEVRSALVKQGLYPGKVTRVHGDVRVELYNSSDVERLLLEGFNFYDSACYPTTLESMVNVKAKDQDVVQCYRCQGYWHTSSYCHEKPRCVRCGGNHELDYCLRPRSDPTCCHCGGPHHAAYKMCPVRARIMKSTQIAFSLSKAGDSSPF